MLIAFFYFSRLVMKKKNVIMLMIFEWFYGFGFKLQFKREKV